MNLVITENLVRVYPMKTKDIKISICNPDSKEIRLKNKTLLGHLEWISVAIPSEIKHIQVLEVNETKLDQICNNDNDKCLPGVDLSLLPEDQRLKV